MSSSTIDIGLDIGKSCINGFFAKGNRFVTQKVPVSSTEKLPARLEKCLENGATSLGLGLEELLKRTRTLGYTCREAERIIHDKTGPRMGLIVTKGSEGTLYARGAQKTPKGVFIPEELIQGIDEKVDARGNVRKAIKKEEIFEIAKVLLEAGAQAVAICLKNSHRNPVHEQMLKQVIAEEISRYFLGQVITLCAHEVSSCTEDYVRLNTTVMDLYLHRNLANSMREADSSLRAFGLATTPRTVNAALGAVRKTSKSRALDIALAPSATPMLGSSWLKRIYGDGTKTVVTLEVGDSCTAIGLAKDGGLELNLRPVIQGLPVDVPMPALAVMDLGGSSIAWLDEKNKIRVGPESTDESVGPACFDRGGEEPTLTDALLVLACIDAKAFRPEGKKLDKRKARAAIEKRIADKLSITPEEAALRIKQETETRIGEMIRGEISSRGCKPDHLEMVCCGEVGPLIGCESAQHAGIGRIRILPFAAAFSAFGAMAGNITYWRSQGFVAELCDGNGKPVFEDYQALRETVETLKEKVRKDVKSERVDTRNAKISVNLVVRQKRGPERMLRLKKSSLASKQDLKTIWNAFRKTVPSESKKKDLELVSVLVRMDCSAPEVKLRVHKGKTKNARAARKGTRKVYGANGAAETEVYEYSRLKCGNQIEGPAIVELAGTSCNIPAGYRITVDQFLNGMIEPA